MPEPEPEPELRQRIINALFEIAPRHSSLEEIADGLLSIPGIAIVDAADIAKVIRKPSTGVYYTPSYIAALERLLAAAVKAEETE